MAEYESCIGLGRAYMARIQQIVILDDSVTRTIVSILAVKIKSMEEMSVDPTTTTTNTSTDQYTP